MFKRFAVLLGVTLSLVNTTVAVAAEGRTAQALAELKAAMPEVRVYEEGGRVAQLFGTPLAFGATPEASAEAFRREHAVALGAPADELLPLQGLPGAPVGEPVLYDPQTGEHRFKMYRYRQVRGGLDVYGADLRLVVRAAGDFPTVMAKSALRELGNYQPQAGDIPAAFDPARDAQTGMTTFSDQRTVIWAEPTKDGSGPRVAVTFVGERGVPDAGPYEKWRFVVDAKSGEILLKEDLIVFENVVGSVSGLVTQGSVAEQCAPEVSTPLPYALVQISGGSSANADADGNFTIPNGGTSAVTVQSFARGTYFRVLNAAGSAVVLSQSVTPPGPVDFLHNAANNDELIRAQINGYANANEVRDFVITHAPAYPVISTQTNFTVNVNRTDGFCPGNAWYDGSSINFCQSDIPSYPNTSFASVSQHEYGHHVVEMGGSGQGAYGEGMGDVLAMLVADDPRLGLGFFYNQCSSPLRNADNTCQYLPGSCSTCGSEIHVCGQLISGCVWDLRNNLAASNPGTYLDILAPLTLASIQVHSGSSITPSITNDFLTLDDDDGDLGNGTPHETEILDAFAAHNMVPSPPPANDACSSAPPICPGTPESGSTISATNDGSSSCGTSSTTPDVWYTYTPATSGSATFSLCSGTNYDAVLSVHTGCPGTSLNDIGCDDDGCGTSSVPAIVTRNVTAGTTYRVRVTGWSGSVGNYTLTITGPACVPSATCDDGVQNQGEDRIDCGGPCPACDCLADGECSDGLFCSGTESCDALGHCQAGSDPCPGQMCSESASACVNCLADADCSDGVFCNGAENCDTNGDCQAGAPPGCEACPTALGDADSDCDVDLADFAAFARCYTGEIGGLVAYDAGCGCFDADADGDVDTDDLADLEARLGGPNQLQAGCVVP